MAIAKQQHQMICPLRRVQYRARLSGSIMFHHHHLPLIRQQKPFHRLKLVVVIMWTLRRYSPIGVYWPLVALQMLRTGQRQPRPALCCYRRENKAALATAITMVPIRNSNKYKEDVKMQRQQPQPQVNRLIANPLVN